MHSSGGPIKPSDNLMKKICHVTTVDISVRFLLLNQLCFLQQKGMQVHVACSDGEWLTQVEAEGIVVHRVTMKREIAPIADILGLFSLYRIFRRERFDLVHVHTPKASLLGAIAARLARVRHVVYTIHGFYFHDSMGRFQRLFYIFWEKIIALSVDAALSQNRADIDTALEEGIYRAEKIDFLGNGIDVQRFTLSSSKDDSLREIRRSLGIPERSRVVGIVARLVREKGFLELFKAVKILALEFPDIYLIVVGPRDDAKQDALTSGIAREMGIEGKVLFTGMRLDLPDLYSAMDVFVLPSHREGFPRVIMEASSMGLPVVATDIRGCREAVEDGKTGILVPVGDPEALASGIARILREPRLARDLGGAGRRKAVDDFDEGRVFRTVWKTYELLMGATG